MANPYNKYSSYKTAVSKFFRLYHVVAYIVLEDGINNLVLIIRWSLIVLPCCTYYVYLKRIIYFKHFPFVSTGNMETFFYI